MLRNNPIIGFIFGMLGPLLGLTVMKYLWFPHDTISEYGNMLVHTKDTMFKVFSLSVLVNLAPFIFFNTKRYDHAARGVFIATMLYVVFIVIVRYVW